MDGSLILFQIVSDNGLVSTFSPVALVITVTLKSHDFGSMSDGVIEISLLNFITDLGSGNTATPAGMPKAITIGYAILACRTSH